MSKLEIAKEIIKENLSSAQCGLYSSRNIAGDEMTNIYDKDGLSIDVCYFWSYFEVFGLTEAEFDMLLYYYNNIRRQTMRLIDADNLQFGWCGSELCADPCDNCNKRTISKEDVDNAPTVEQECYITGAQWNEFMKEHRRPQGEWNCRCHSTFPQYEPDEYRCSICNGRGGKLDKFCRHCGADMRRGRE